MSDLRELMSRAMKTQAVGYPSSEVFRALVYNYRIYNQLLTTVSLGEIPAEKHLQLQKGERHPATQHFGQLPAPVMRASLRGWGQKPHPIPSLLPPGNGHPESSTQLLRNVQSVGVFQIRQSPGADREEAERNCGS